MISLDSRVSRLATRRLYPTDSLKKIKRLFVHIGTHYTRNYKNKYTGPLFNKKMKK